MTIRATAGQSPADAPSASPTEAVAIPKQTPLLPPAASPQAPLTAEEAMPGIGRLALDTEQARAAVRVAYEYLDHRKDDLQLVEAASERFFPRSVERDTLGMVHVRLDRIHHGLRVFGEQLIVHLDRDNVVSCVTGDEDAALPIFDLVKLIGAGQALDAAETDFGLTPQGLSTSELLLYGLPDGEYRTAYKVELANYEDGEQPLRMHYFIDATSGKVLDKYNLLDVWLPPKPSPVTCPAALAAATAQGTSPSSPSSSAAATDDNSLYSGKVAVMARQGADGTWSLEDPGRGGLATYDARNRFIPFGRIKFKDGNNVWGEPSDDPRARAAIDAHYGAQMTWDFYLNVLGRNSIDGNGERLLSYVHLRKNYNNAYWNGRQMQYGDGDGKVFSPLTCLDVAGHEISHGLTERTAGLVYRGESGGLNEAMSDIFGKGVQWYAARSNPAVKFSWAVGADIFTPDKPGDGLRYLDDPSRDGYSIDHYSNYPKQTEVHGSSGIANNAFYLMAAGGVNRTSKMRVEHAIGMEKALKIMYRAEVYYMTPNTNFAGARQACLRAATDLHGADSQEVSTVAQAWEAVGVR